MALGVCVDCPKDKKHQVWSSFDDQFRCLTHWSQHRKRQEKDPLTAVDAPTHTSSPTLGMKTKCPGCNEMKQRLACTDGIRRCSTCRSDYVTGTPSIVERKSVGNGGKRRYSDDQLREACLTATTWMQAAQMLGVKVGRNVMIQAQKIGVELKNPSYRSRAGTVRRRANGQPKPDPGPDGRLKENRTEQNLDGTTDRRLLTKEEKDSTPEEVAADPQQLYTKTQVENIVRLELERTFQGIMKRVEELV